MSPQVVKLLHVDVGAATPVAFELTVAGTSEIMTVSSQGQTVELEDSAIGTVIQQREIEDLPLQSRRHTDLALMTPGVT